MMWSQDFAERCFPFCCVFRFLFFGGGPGVGFGGPGGGFLLNSLSGTKMPCFARCTLFCFLLVFLTVETH